MRVGALSESDTARWLDVLDGTEKERAGRFVFPRHRIQYVAAHALTRAALSHVASVAATDWRFADGPNGKPVAWCDGRPAPLSFNLSHSEGIVGVAVLPRADASVGFDLEALDRKVDLDVAERYFRPEEVAWLYSLEATERPQGFLRLWTLKEAFIKATGEGLSRDLASFWFETSPPRLHLVPPADLPETGWRFEQRVLDGGFVAAGGGRIDGEQPIGQAWREIDPATFTPFV